MPPGSGGFCYLLLERRQMCIFSCLGDQLLAELRMGDGNQALGRSQVDLPLALNLPYSVTT